MRNLVYYSLSALLVGCATPLTQNVWVPIDPSQRPYFSQVNAQCNIYAQNVAAGVEIPYARTSNAGNALAQGLIGALTVAATQSDAYNQCMYAAGWQLQQQLTPAGVSSQYSQRAKQLSDTSDWKNLESLAREWIRAQPKNYVAYAFYANSFLGQRNYSAALIHIDQSINLGNKHFSIYLNRGIANEQLKNRDDAWSDYSQCLSLDSQNVICSAGLTRMQVAIGGTYLAQNDIQNAIKYLEPAAEKGNAVAQVNLGVALSRLKTPVEKDTLVRMIDLYKKSSDQGNIYAKNNLAFLYINGGPGLDKNIERGLSLLEQAAQGGHPDAQYWYGAQFLPNGRKPEDKDQAKVWFERAIANKQSTPDQVNRAKAALVRLGPRADPYWIQATNTNCKLWNSNPLPDEKVEWNGSCVNGMADGSGSAKWIFSGGSYSLVKAQFKEGRRIDGPAENTDTRTGFITKGTFVNGKLDGPVERINIQSGAVTRGNMIDGKFVPN